MFDCNPEVGRRHLRAIALAGVLFCAPVPSQELVVTIEQGTNMALALAPDGETLIVDLMGQLWSLPVTGGAAQPLTPAEESARNPRISPDGSQVVYQQLSRGQWDLWLMDVATTSRRRLTGPPHDEVEPDFSEDGRSIVFVAERDGTRGLYRIRPATDTVTALARAAGRVSWPSVSERGEIAYVEQLGDGWALRLLRSDGAPVTLLASPNPLRAPSWRPGGGVLVYAEQTGRAGSELRMVVLSEEPVVKTLTNGEDVFGFRAAWRSPAEIFYTADGRIWRRTLGSVTRQVVPLFAGVAADRAPSDLRVDVVPTAGARDAQGIRGLRTSPSGRAAAFTALGDLWLVTDDGDLRQLTDDSFLDIDPAFTPDGERIVFASDRAGSMDLWALTLDSGHLERLTTGPAKAFAPVVADDGEHLAYLATTGFGPWAPSDLRVLGLDEPRRSETLARDLYDASDLAWDATGGTVTVSARAPADVAGSGERRARYSADVERHTGHWYLEPGQQGRAIQPDTDLARPSWSPPDEGEPYVIQIDRLFDGVGTQYRRYMDVHIDGRRIAAVVPRGLRPLPETVIDARAYTALPGLIELHAHHSALGGERLGRAWLAFGVTTVREVGTRRDDGLERKEAWASGRRLGPRLLLSARHDEVSGWSRAAESTRPAYDILEIYRGQPAPLRGSLLETARRFGVPVFSEDLYPAIRLGINGLEHVGSRIPSPYDLERSDAGRSYDDVLGLLMQTGAAVTPALAAFGGFAELAAGRRPWSEDEALRRLFTAEERSAWQRRGRATELDGLERTVAALVRSGARVTAGSDAPRVPYGLGLHAELSLMTEAGLPNDQVLRLATGEGALALGMERDLGTIEAGKLADLVIVDGNPLVTMRDTLEIVAVVVDGVWYGRDGLLAPP